jgi:guanylate kinase
MQSPFVIISSPSGGGKSTIAKKILQSSRRFAKAVSATTRVPRIGEKNGKDYYFLSVEEFRDKIAQKKFLEWEEVYTDKFYGTLLSEIEKLSKQKKIVILTLDIHGALKLKKEFQDRVLTIFLDIPNLEILRERLQYRATESSASLEDRLARAKYELSYKGQFDIVIENTNLTNTVEQAITAIDEFLHKCKL